MSTIVIIWGGGWEMRGGKDPLGSSMNLTLLSGLKIQTGEALNMLGFRQHRSGKSTMTGMTSHVARLPRADAFCHCSVRFKAERHQSPDGSEPSIIWNVQPLTKGWTLWTSKIHKRR